MLDLGPSGIYTLGQSINIYKNRRRIKTGYSLNSFIKALVGA